MAKCERKEIPQPKCEYVLTLTEREARAVCSLLGNGKGSPDGPWLETDRVFSALVNAGVDADYGYHLFKGVEGADKWPKEAPNA